MHQKHELELKNKAFVLLADEQNNIDKLNLSRSIVAMCSFEASKKYIAAGMKWTEARATYSGVIWRLSDSKLYKDAQNKIVNELVACSPRVSAREPGIFILDASGRERLGGEGKLCRDLMRLISKLGYVHAQVGIADSAFAALVATRSKSRWHIVPPGRDSEFLKPLSVEHVRLDDETADMFVDLGIKSMGEFAKLPIDSVQERFGSEVARAQQLVLGFDKSQPSVPVPDKQFSAGIEVGGAIDSLNQTVFLFKSMLDHIESQLRYAGLWAEELRLQFINDDEIYDDRNLKLVRPSCNSKFLLEVLRLSVEAQPLQREYTALKLSVTKFCPESYEQVRVDDEDSVGIEIKQNNLLQKFVTRLGEKSLVRAISNDQYAPELSGVWSPVVKSSNPNCIRIDANYIHSKLGTRGVNAGLVLKNFSEPLLSFVELSQGMPVAITYKGKWHKVSNITSAECLSGLWWEQNIKNSYYDVMIEPKYDESTTVDTRTMILLVHNHEKKGWYIVGVYD